MTNTKYFLQTTITALASHLIVGSCFYTYFRNAPFAQTGTGFLNKYNIEDIYVPPTISNIEGCPALTADLQEYYDNAYASWKNDRQGSLNSSLKQGFIKKNNNTLRVIPFDEQFPYADHHRPLTEADINSFKEKFILSPSDSKIKNSKHITKRAANEEMRDTFVDYAVNQSNSGGRQQELARYFIHAINQENFSFDMTVVLQPEGAGSTNQLPNQNNEECQIIRDSLHYAAGFARDDTFYINPEAPSDNASLFLTALHEVGHLIYDRKQPFISRVPIINRIETGSDRKAEETQMFSLETDFKGNLNIETFIQNNIDVSRDYDSQSKSIDASTGLICSALATPLVAGIASIAMGLMNHRRD